MTTDKPQVFLDLDGPGGNTLAILAACKRAAKRAGWPRDTIEAFQTEMLCDSREHALDVVFECFDVSCTRTVAVEADREQVR